MLYQTFKRRTAMFLMLILMLLFTCMFLARADTSIGLTYNQIAGSVGLGFAGNTEHNITENVNFELDVNGAQAGTVRGRWTAEVTAYDYFRIYQAGLFTGPRVRNLGYTADIGAAVHLPILTGSGVGVGIVGRSGGEFARESLSDFGERHGYDPQSSVAEVFPAPTGLSIRPGQSLNILVYTDFEYKSIDVNVKLLPQLTGKNKAHAALITGKTDFHLLNNLSLQVGLDVGLQHYKNSVELETASLAAVTLKMR